MHDSVSTLWPPDERDDARCHSRNGQPAPHGACAGPLDRFALALPTVRRARIRSRVPRERLLADDEQTRVVVSSDGDGEFAARVCEHALCPPVLCSGEVLLVEQDAIGREHLAARVVGVDGCQRREGFALRVRGRDERERVDIERREADIVARAQVDVACCRRCGRSRARAAAAGRRGRRESVRERDDADEAGVGEDGDAFVRRVDEDVLVLGETTEGLGNRDGRDGADGRRRG